MRVAESGIDGSGVPPFAAVDVHYPASGGALAALVLAGDRTPGLGARVHAEFGVPVVGVAKTFFATATHAIPVVRGHASRPLYVTAAGWNREVSYVPVGDL